jgi:hypothetical protein
MGALPYTVFLTSIEPGILRIRHTVELHVNENESIFHPDIV